MLIVLVQGAQITNRYGSTSKTRTLFYSDLKDHFELHGISCTTYDRDGWDLDPYSPRHYDIDTRMEEIRPLVEGHESILIGHSEGGMLVHRMARKYNVRAVVSLTPPYGSLFEHWKHRYEKIPNCNKYYSILDNLFSCDIDMTPKAFLDWASKYPCFYGWQSFRWIKDHWKNKTYVPSQEVEVPTLILTGSRDDRVLPDNSESWERWASGNPLIEHKTLDMNHNLRSPENLFLVGGVVSRWLEEQDLLDFQR